MPFIGRDWRADGEQWTKTAIGTWQPARAISSSLTNTTCLSDIFNTLDMINSVDDIRRWNYIVKVDNLSSLFKIYFSFFV